MSNPTSDETSKNSSAYFGGHKTNKMLISLSIPFEFTGKRNRENRTCCVCH